LELAAEKVRNNKTANAAFDGNEIIAHPYGVNFDQGWLSPDPSRLAPSYNKQFEFASAKPDATNSRFQTKRQEGPGKSATFPRFRSVQLILFRRQSAF